MKADKRFIEIDKEKFRAFLDLIVCLRPDDLVEAAVENGLIVEKKVTEAMADEMSNWQVAYFEAGYKYYVINEALFDEKSN